MNNKNNNLLMFLFGILSYIAIIPILEEIVNIVLAWFEYFKIKPSKVVLKGNKELQELQEEIETLENGGEKTFAMGFHYNPENDEEENFEDC